MYNKDCKQFYMRKSIPQEAVPLISTLANKFSDYLVQFQLETTYIEVEDMHNKKREIKFLVVFNQAQSAPDMMERILDTIINLVFSEAKAEGEKLIAESYKNLVTERIRKYREGSCQQ